MHRSHLLGVAVGAVVSIVTSCTGVCDNFGGDTDGDGVCDAIDDCDRTSNGDQLDSDDDGVGDACDVPPLVCEGRAGDVDADNVCGVFDNCPDVANDDQRDTDNDGRGDACDVEDCDGVDNDGDGDVDEGFADGDDDGVVDCLDRCRGADDVDSDGDGILDCEDECPGDASNDADRDGVCGDVDTCPSVRNPGFEYPGQADTDGDGIGDACDVEECDGVDNDGDGFVDEALVDDDLDGLCDGIDGCPHDPVNDDDSDGLCGIDDNCPFDGNADQADEDGDDIGDVCDLNAPGLCGPAAPLGATALPDDLTINDMVGSANLVFVTTSSRTQQLGNRVLAIDPTTATIAWSLFVGGDPDRIALADDGRSLYVGFHDTTQVRLVDVIDRRLCGAFSLGLSLPSEIEIVPGRPDLVLVVVANGGAITTLYQSGRALPDVVAAGDIAVADAETVFGRASSDRVARFTIDRRGLHQRSGAEGPAAGNDLQYAGGRLYTGDGSIVDPVTLRDIDQLSVNGPFIVDADHGEAYVDEGAALVVLNLSDDLRERSVPLPGNLRGFRRALARFGTNGLAVADEDAVAFFFDVVGAP